MAAFYEKHIVEHEAYDLIRKWRHLSKTPDFTDIFPAFFKLQSHDPLSDLYQDLSCQHHLIQESSDKRPMIPGLTPAGFAHWMTTWILAYPDQEASRLEKVVVSMPIDADGETVDGKPERLPKVCLGSIYCKTIAHTIASKSHAIFYQVKRILKPERHLMRPYMIS
jgi:hypothetical protein